jgi:hypothetical protein
LCRIKNFPIRFIDASSVEEADVLVWKSATKLSKERSQPKCLVCNEFFFNGQIDLEYWASIRVPEATETLSQPAGPGKKVDYSDHIFHFLFHFPFFILK